VSVTARGAPRRPTPRLAAPEQPQDVHAVDAGGEDRPQISQIGRTPPIAGALIVNRLSLRSSSLDCGRALVHRDDVRNSQAFIRFGAGAELCRRQTAACMNFQ